MPEHHLRAVEIIREYASRAIPIVTFMDTPGAVCANRLDTAATPS